MDNWGQGTFTLSVSRLYRRAVGVAVLQEDGLPLDVAEVAQSVPEGLEAGRRRRERARNEQPEPGHVRGWLGLGRERHREQAQAERDNAPDSAVPHSHLLT